MAAWLATIKAILPYVTQVLTATIPAFTKKLDRDDAGKVIPDQIAELQKAVTHNAESIKILAAQLQQLISAIDTGSSKVEKKIRIMNWLSIVAVTLSVFAIFLFGL